MTKELKEADINYKIFMTPNKNYVIMRGEKHWLKQYVNLESEKVEDAMHFSSLKDAEEFIKDSASHRGYNLQLVKTISYNTSKEQTIKEATTRPSREEIAQRLNLIVQLAYDEAVDKQYLQYAIEELKK